jgi:hypothetical protein
MDVERSRDFRGWCSVLDALVEDATDQPQPFSAAPCMLILS